ncbi:MAG: hypothetical protein AAF810_27620 [Cyanobacteria bacterium P01_D01_bin.36]
MRPMMRTNRLARSPNLLQSLFSPLSARSRVASPLPHDRFVTRQLFLADS